MPKPEKKFQAGGIEASIFENEAQQNGKPIKIKKSLSKRGTRAPMVPGKAPAAWT